MEIKKEDWAGVFNRAASTYDQIGPHFFSYFGTRLVDLANLTPGSRVLDVATGRGAVLKAALKKVGSEGQVIGIDLASAMIEETAAELQNKGFTNSQVYIMDAEQLEFEEASFDAVLCGFAIFFFPDPLKALGEIQRVLKPGGLLGLSTWGKGDERWKWIDDLSPRPVNPAASQNPPLVKQFYRQSFDEPSQLENFLNQGQFSNIKVLSEETEFTYSSEEDWWDTQWSHGARIYLEQIPSPLLESTRKVAYSKMQTLKEANGIPQIMRALFAYANKPLS